MVVVKIELWPHGDKTKAQCLGTMTIANDGTGTQRIGNYDVALAHAAASGKKGVWKQGKVRGYVRTMSPYHLVKMALEATVGRYRSG